MIRVININVAHTKLRICMFLFSCNGYVVAIGNYVCVSVVGSVCTFNNSILKILLSRS